MNSIILLLMFVLHGQGEGEFANEAVVKGLMSRDRFVRKAAVQQAEELSKKELIALAQNAVDNERLRRSGVIYAFHRILFIAQQKGFGVRDAMTLLESPGASRHFRAAILDWLREVGSKAISATDAVDLIPVFDRILANQQEHLEVRLEAHNVACGLIAKINQKLQMLGKETADEAWKEKAAKTVRDHISQVCNIVADATESDKAVESLAGYVPQYCFLYLKDGLVEESTLKSCVEQALQNKKRSDECRKKLQGAFLGLKEAIEWAGRVK